MSDNFILNFMNCKRKKKKIHNALKLCAMISLRDCILIFTG